LSCQTGNVKAYASGHYQIYRITVQAACDYKSRFVYAALAVPGGANDIAALGKTKLSQVIRKLPLGNLSLAKIHMFALKFY